MENFEMNQVEEILVDGVEETLPSNGKLLVPLTAGVALVGASILAYKMIPKVYGVVRTKMEEKKAMKEERYFEDENQSEDQE